MSNFIARVQLSNGTHTNYTLLRDRLIEIGFTKRVISKKGIQYRLPNGNYRIESDKDVLVVLSAVQKIAQSMDKEPMVLIVEVKGDGMAWGGLQVC
jgi:hypothetical protein